MDNVYIFNFWYSTNYGACLTAFALSETLKELGYNPILVDTMSDYWKSLHNKSYASKFAKKYFQVININNLITDNNNPEPKNFIVGSDQVFNPYNHDWHFSNFNNFLLYFATPNDKKIALSASFGFDTNTMKSKIPTHILEKMKNALKSFDFVTVREYSGIDLCKKVFDIDTSSYIPDPVFYIDKSKYIELTKFADTDYKNKIVTYIIDPKYADYNKYLKHLSKKYNAEVLKISGTYENWLSAIYNCKFVVTDSFHATCFALIFNKPVLLVNKKRLGTRLDTLLENINALNSAFDNIDDILTSENLFLDYNCNNVNNWIATQANIGIEFLKNALLSKDKNNDKLATQIKYLQNIIYDYELRNYIIPKDLKIIIRKNLRLFYLNLPEFIKQFIRFLRMIYKTFHK